MPGIIPYMSFVLFTCGNIVGPVFGFRDFIDLMEFKGKYKTLPRGLSEGY
jgi:hypothetical protein